jgi:hypothetical protein
MPRSVGLVLVTSCTCIFRDDACQDRYLRTNNSVWDFDAPNLNLFSDELDPSEVSQTMLPLEMIFLRYWPSARRMKAVKDSKIRMGLRDDCGVTAFLIE